MFTLTLCLNPSSSLAQAPSQEIQIQATLRFFEKETFTAPFSKSLCSDYSYQIDIPRPENGLSLQKLSEVDFVCGNLKTRLEIYYHQKQSQNYFSQQIFFYEGDQQIALCTSYFPETQNFLVPGACAGLGGEKVYGLAIFK